MGAVALWRGLMVGFALWVGIISVPGVASAGAKEQELIDEAAVTLKEFLNDPDYGALRDILGRARAVMIIPDFVKAGLVLGGQSGDGVLIARGADGRWSYPAFYELVGGSIGLQAGASKQEILMIIMSDKVLDSLLDGEMTFGGGVAVAAGPTGAEAGAPVERADVYTYSRSSWAYAGLVVNGGRMAADNGENRRYYGAPTTPRAILLDRKHSNSGAESLRRLLGS